jgi:hypothetical protein
MVQVVVRRRKWSLSHTKRGAHFSRQIALRDPRPYSASWAREIEELWKTIARTFDQEVLDGDIYVAWANLQKAHGSVRLTPTAIHEHYQPDQYAANSNLYQVQVGSERFETRR